MQFVKIHDRYNMDLNYLLAGSRQANASNVEKVEVVSEDRFDKQDRMLHHIIELLEKW